MPYSYFKALDSFYNYKNSVHPENPLSGHFSSSRVTSSFCSNGFIIFNFPSIT